MTDDVPTDSETVSVDVSMLPAGSPACSDEDDKDEHEDSGHVDDDILRSESLRIQRGKSAKFGYLPMMTRESDSRGDSHACHAPDESRVHGVHEGELPRHSTVGIQ